MSTLKFNKWENPDGTENYKCRAWVNFNGTGTPAIRAAGNVSSITDNGAGDYTVNFTTALPDTNYCVSGAARHADSQPSAMRVVSISGAGLLADAMQTTSVRVSVAYQNASLEDQQVVTVAIFR